MSGFFEWREAPKGDFAVIGNPISHSRSPQMHSAAFAAMGLDLVYNAIRVDPGEVREAVAHLMLVGYRGINVTVPHKAEAKCVVDETDAFAERCESVNTIGVEDGRLVGINTDGPGFIDTLSGVVEPGCDVLLLGAGGSARAIALALSVRGYKLRIFNRTAERAHALVRDLAIDAAVIGQPAAKRAELVVNATSASLGSETLEVQWADKATVAYDLVYGDTAFLRDARAAGYRTVDGKGLLVAQGARSIDFWLGMPAPRDVMLEAIQ